MRESKLAASGRSPASHEDWPSFSACCQLLSRAAKAALKATMLFRSRVVQHLTQGIEPPTAARPWYLVLCAERRIAILQPGTRRASPRQAARCPSLWPQQPSTCASSSHSPLAGRGCLATGRHDAIRLHAVISSVAQHIIGVLPLSQFLHGLTMASSLKIRSKPPPNTSNPWMTNMLL